VREPLLDEPIDRPVVDLDLAVLLPLTVDDLVLDDPTTPARLLVVDLDILAEDDQTERLLTSDLVSRSGLPAVVGDEDLVVEEVVRHLRNPVEVRSAVLVVEAVRGGEV